MLALNALLGLGTALAPVFVAVFVGLGFWWGLPLTSAILLGALIMASLPLPLRVGAPTAAAPAGAGRGIPTRFWVFAGFAVLYGICETLNGNWSQLDMTSELGASTTVGGPGADGVLGDGHRRPGRLRRRRALGAVATSYHILPFLLAGTFVFIGFLSDGDTALGVLAFALAGLGCSALLPLTISYGQEELVSMSAAAAGGVIAFYQVGYGLAAFGVGPLLDHGTELPTVYKAAAIVAAAMGLLSFTVTRGRRASPAGAG